MNGKVKPLLHANDELVLSPSDPLPSARKFVELHYRVESAPTLHHYGAIFYEWTGTHYQEVDSAAIRARMYKFLENAKRWDAKAEAMVPYQPTSRKVSDVIDALKAETNLPKTVVVPAWVGVSPEMYPPASEFVACENGLLHLPTLDPYTSTPVYFTHNALDYSFDPDAPDPKHWLIFLGQLWPDDQESIDTLQEIFGYSLTPDTRQQKIFLGVGPKRSGKGTIGRVLTGLLGQANVSAPTLASLEQNFGLAPLIGKRLAIIADARLGGRADQHRIAERLLSISGEDSLTVDRKFLPAWTGRLSTRFLILTNELPRLSDASGALAHRFVVLRLTESFYGREDHDLTDRLLAERPGILNWAITGWHRLQERGHFVQPVSAADAIQEIEDLASPVGAFVRECCNVAPCLQVSVAKLFSEWKSWSEEQGRSYAGDQQSFGRDLRAAVPHLKLRQPRDRTTRKQVRTYEGIDLV